jgi:hypothetical protein
MIVRYNIKCKTCETPITLRVQIGHSSFEEYNFLCPSCKENLSIGLYVDNTNISFKIEPIKNCEKTKKSGREIYLNSEIFTTNSIMSIPKNSPALFFMHQLEKGQIKKYFNKETSKLLWVILSRSFEQHKLKNYDLKEKFINEYRNERKLDATYYFKDCLFDFCTYHINKSYYSNITSVFEIIGKSKKVEIIYLRNFLRKKYREKLPLVFEVFNEYFNAFDIHYPILLFILSEFYDIDDLYFPYINFSSIKMIYGNLFEVFSELVMVSACLFNIIEGRSYDRFKTMDIGKYENIDKAKRIDPFRNYSLFTTLCNEFDSNLRNASHHGHIQHNKKNNTIEYYTEAPKNKKEIDQKEYLIKINKIFLNTLSVLSIWLFIIIIND